MPERHIKHASSPTARRGGSGGLGLLMAALFCIGVGVGIGFLAFSAPKKTDEQQKVAKKEMEEFGKKKNMEGMLRGIEIQSEKTSRTVDLALKKERKELASQHKDEIEKLNADIEEAGKNADEKLQKTQKLQKEYEEEITNLKTVMNDIIAKNKAANSAPPVPRVLVLKDGAMAVLNLSAKQEISEIKISVTKTNGEKYVHYLYRIAPHTSMLFSTSELKHKDKSLSKIAKNNELEFSIQYNYDNGKHKAETIKPVFAAKN